MRRSVPSVTRCPRGCWRAMRAPLARSAEVSPRRCRAPGAVGPARPHRACWRPWILDQHNCSVACGCRHERVGQAALWPPQREARPRGDGSAGDGEARGGHCRGGGGGDADRVPARGGKPSRARSAPQGVGGLMGMTTDTAALRAAAQRLVDSIENDERRTGGLISRISLRRSAELRRLLFETRVEADHHYARAPRAAPGLMATTSTAAQRRRARERRRHISVLGARAASGDGADRCERRGADRGGGCCGSCASADAEATGA